MPIKNYDVPNIFHSHVSLPEGNGCLMACNIDWLLVLMAIVGLYNWDRYMQCVSNGYEWFYNGYVGKQSVFSLYNGYYMGYSQLMG